MNQTRRRFIATSAAAAASAAVSSSIPGTARASARSASGPDHAQAGEADAGRPADAHTAERGVGRPSAAPGVSYEPWLEIDAAALRHNAREVGRLAGGRPVLAVVKNNAYGLGIQRVGPVLERAPEIAGLAVVKPEEAVALRDAGVRKPILLMGLVTVPDGTELVRRDVRLAPFTDDAPGLLREIGRAHV